MDEYRKKHKETKEREERRTKEIEQLNAITFSIESIARKIIAPIEAIPNKIVAAADAVKDQFEAQEQKEAPEKKQKNRREELGFWISAVTLALVGVYTFITIRIWCTSKDTEQKQLSAFVTVNDLLAKEIKDEGGKVIKIDYSPVIENSGETAVRHGTYIGGITPWEGVDNSQAPDVPPKMVFSEIPIHVSIGPRSKQDSVRTNIGANSEMLELMKNRRAVFYIFGRIAYFDVFERKQHITQYCFLIGRKAKEDIRKEIPITFCGGNTNCTDDECDEKR
jgi:hypothetical protein